MNSFSPAELIEDVMTINRKSLRLLGELEKNASLISEKCESLWSKLDNKVVAEAPKQEKRSHGVSGHNNK